MKLFPYIVLAAALVFTGCENDNPATGSDINIERTIIYSINNIEIRSTLETEAEWDAMLDRFCELSREGKEVVFYNTDPIPHHDNVKSSTKDNNHTITTTDREELKKWMKAMEKDGLTVTVSYDDGTGTWNGTAYATAPAINTSGAITGTWRLRCMVVTQLDDNGGLISSDLFVPEEGGNTMYYTFSDDGTMSLNVTAAGSTVATGNSTWTLSDDGVLCTDLLPSDGCWNVNWISNSTLIISHQAEDTEDGELFYQLQFDIVTAE